MTIEYDILTLLETEKYQFNEIHKRLNKPDSLISRHLTELIKKKWVVKNGSKKTGGVFYFLNKDNREVHAFLEMPDIYHQRDKILQQYTDLRHAKEWLSKLTGLSYDEVQEKLDNRIETEIL